MIKRGKQNSISKGGDATIASPFPLPRGVFDFGLPLDIVPRPLSVGLNDGRVMPLAPLALTDGDGLRGVIVALMKEFTPDELKWLMIDFTGLCAPFDQSLYGVCDVVSGEFAPLALASVDEEAARRITDEKNGPNILLVINGNEPSDVEGLWLTVERLTVYAAARVYTLVSPTTVRLPCGHDTISRSDLSAFDGRDAERIIAAFRRGNI